MKNNKTNRKVPEKFQDQREFSEKYQKNIKELKAMGIKIPKNMPFDINDADDLIDVLEDAFCELMDVGHHYISLDMLEANFNKTIEKYESGEWMFGSYKNSSYDLPSELLFKTILSFSKLEEIKKEEFIYLLEKALSFNSEKIGVYLFGEVHDVKDVEAFLKSTEKALFDLYYEYNDSASYKRKQLKTLMMSLVSK